VGAGSHTAVVADDGQVLGALLGQSLNNLVGAAAAQETAEHNSGAVGDHVHGFLNGNYLIVHVRYPHKCKIGTCRSRETCSGRNGSALLEDGGDAHAAADAQG